MKKNYVAAMFLILLGIAILLCNFGFIEINIVELIKFWPIILIIIGLGFFFTPDFKDENNKINKE